MAKTRTTIIPSKNFEIERVLDNGLRCEVAFYDLASVKSFEVTDSMSNTTQTMYEVDKYLVTLFNKPSYIENNYAELLHLAKEQEIAELSASIRAKRDKLLLDTDWTQCVDCQLSNEQKEAYRVYRQSLRDIPEQEGFPYNVVFPEM